MTPSSKEEVNVWAWTEDFDMIIVEGFDDEALYGLQNRHTGVIEITEPIFSNAVTYLIQLQDEFTAASDLIGEDGQVLMDDMIRVTYKPKKEYH